MATAAAARSLDTARAGGRHLVSFPLPVHHLINSLHNCNSVIEVLGSLDIFNPIPNPPLEPPQAARDPIGVRLARSFLSMMIG